MFIEAVMPSNLLTPFSSCPQSFPASGSLPISWLFTSGGQSIGASASAPVLQINIQLISFRIDKFDLLAVRGILKNLLQHHSLKTSILWYSVFFMVQLSHPYMATGKTTAWTIQIFVGKVMSLLFNMLSSFVIACLLQSKHLLISWLQSLSAVILEPKKISLSLHCFHCFPIYFAPWSDGTEFHDLSVLNVASSIAQSCLFVTP